MSLGPHDKREDPREIAEQAIAERNELVRLIVEAEPNEETYTLAFLRAFDLAELIVKREGL